MKIENRIIDNNHPPFIIADISSNHKQIWGLAHDIIYAAKEAKCDAIKFQAYNPCEITLDDKLISLYKESCLPYDWLPNLFDYARKLDIIPFASVFSIEGIKELEKLNCPAYKIASFETNHFPLLEAVRKTNKPVFISTGMMQYSDFHYLSYCFSPLNTIFMKCVSNYPAKAGDFYLKTIPEMQNQFGDNIGISDHSERIGVSIAAVALGAVAVEKHFTTTRNNLYLDNFSLEPSEMKELVKGCRDAWEALGCIDYTIYGDRQYERSLYTIADIKKGEILTEYNVGILRPNKGMNAKAYYSILGSKAKIDMKRGTPLEAENIE